MNWLGEIVQKEISNDDIVLDIGCGIMQAIDGLSCKMILGCDIFPRYLDEIKHKYPTIVLGVDEIQKFRDESYDIVIALDVVEHVDHQKAIKMIRDMQDIARKKVIIYTPRKFDENEESVSNAWGLGYNEHQRHKCLVSKKELEDLGFNVNNDNIDGGNYAIWQK